MAALELVLLPGLDGTGLLFRPLLDALPRWIRPEVVAYPDHVPMGYDSLLPLVKAALPEQAPFVILGESFGGPLALRAALQAKRAPSAVIFSASFVTCPFRFAPRAAAPLVPAWPFRALPMLSRIKRRCGGYPDAALAALSHASLSRPRPAVYAARIRQIMQIDARADLRACRGPLLYLQGTEDRIVAPHNLALMRALRPDMEVERLSCGHMVLQDEPQAAARAITTFLERRLPDLMATTNT